MQVGTNNLYQNQPRPVENGLSSQAFQHQSYLEKTGDISIVTDEGDVVTFSQNSLAALSLSGESSTSPLGNSMSFTAQSVMSQSMEFSVEGDLNEQELADIANLYDSLTNIASDFFNGDYGKAMVGAMSLGDLGSLASLDASFTQTQITSTQISSYHALPKDSEGFIDAFSNKDIPDNKSAGKEQDMLAARWRQITDFLDKQSAILQQNKEQQGQRRNHSKEMMANIATTLEQNPRLSPFTTPLADRAINEASANADQSPLHTLNQKQFLQNDFVKEFQNWLAV